MTQRQHEQTLNVWFADILEGLGLDASPEVIYPGNRIDVEVRIGQPEAKVALEAEHGQSRAKQREAIKDADSRLKANLVDCSVAICYPNNTTRESLPTATFEWTVRDSIGASENWQSGDIDQLVAVIRRLPDQLGEPDAVAKTLSDRLDNAVSSLTNVQMRMLAEALDLPGWLRKSGKVKASSAPNANWDRAAKRALLVVATAVMFHSRLDSHLPGLRPEHDNRVPGGDTPFTGDWPPAMAHQCLRDDAPIDAFYEAWDLILALDYKPIFETACAALQSCPPDHVLAEAIRQTADAALKVMQRISSLRHDLLGRIFHTVLDTARYDGSFYTTTAAATLLASLAISEDMCDWNDPDAVKSLRITDPTCGTGTLLMAAAERIRDIAPQLRDDEEVARALIENVLSGYDVNLTATHMAATTLGLLSPTTRFQNMKIGRALLGVDDAGKAHLGSLEFLDRQPMMMPWPGMAQSVSQIDDGSDMAQPDASDLVIMNPPFTRDSLRHDQFSSADEAKLKAREKRLFANKPTYMAGGSGAFLYLAENLNKAKSGTLAAVLPLVGATDASGLGIRKFLGSHYHIETIVASHDPKRIYFSESTNIGEILLICRRWDSDDGEKPPTRIVNLALNPTTPADAITVARAIENESAASQGYGTIQQWHASRIASGNWGGVQFLSPYLCEKFFEMREYQLFLSTALGEIAEVGPLGRRIRASYTRTDMPDALGRMALWQHDTKFTQNMAAEPDSHIAPKPSNAHLADRYWRQRSRLLLTTRLNLPTVRVPSVRLTNPVLGSSWVPCNIKPSNHELQDLEKTLCVFLNSSIGILSILGDRTNKKPTYPNMSLADLRKLIVPDFAALGDHAVETLASAYDEHADKVLLPLPQMDSDPVRAALDDAVCAALGVDSEIVTTIRRLLAAEPSVTGERYRPQSPAATATREKLLTAADLLELHAKGIRGELIRGVFYETMSAGIEHGQIAMNLGMLLGIFIKSKRLGKLFGSDSGVLLERDPDTVREPDIGFISAEKAPLDERIDGYANVVPDLVVEIVSPNDNLQEVRDKARMWLSFGVRLVWVAFPNSRSVDVYPAGGAMFTLHDGDTLDGGDVLPGFSCLVSDVFDV